MTSQDLFTQSSKDDTTPGILKNREEKKKLVDDIQNLKKLRANINQSLGYYKIARPFPEKSFVDCEDKFVRNLQKVPDGLVILKEELYRYSGIYCAKYEQDKEYRFEFHSCVNVSKSETYFVQILTEEAMGKLGFWKMPLLLDVNVILSKCPIEDMRQVKSFVKLCKYYLDCQNSRKTQFEDLKTYIGELHTCSLQANLEIYTNIQLQMFMLREIETDKCYDIVLYIVYELTDSRPNKLITDSLYEEALSEDVIRKLKKFFKKFKLLELKSAFEEIVDEENEELFQWQKSFKDKDVAIENDEVDSDGFSQEEENDLSEMRSLNEEKENKEGVQKNEEDSEVNNKKLKKTSGKRKVATDEKLEDTQSANKKIDDEENSTTRGIKKVDKIRFEEENSTKEKEDDLDETDEEEDFKKRQIKKKIRRKVKAKVFKTLEKSGKQTKLNFLRQNINTEQIQEAEEKEGTDEIHEATKQTQNPKNNQETLQKSSAKNKFENKKNEIIKIGEKSHETQNEEEIFTEQNENLQIEILESDLGNKNQTNIPKTKKGRKTAKEKKDQNQNQIISKEKYAKKKKKLKGVGEKRIKSSFDLSNFVLERKKPASSSISANILNPISLGENIAKSSARIKRKQTHPRTETEIRETIKVNKPIYKSPEKRPRSDSSDSDLDEVFEEPERSLLKNLEEIQENMPKSSAGIDNKKVKKIVKRVKKGNKKAKK